MHIPALNAIQAQRTGFITTPNGTMMCHLYDVTDREQLSNTDQRETPAIITVRSEPDKCLIPELAVQHATQTRDVELSMQNAARPSESVNTDTPRPEAHAELTDFTDAFIEELAVIHRQITPDDRIETIEGRYEPAYDELHNHEEYVLRALIGCVQNRVKLPKTMESPILSNAYTYADMDIGADEDTTTVEKKFTEFKSGIYTDQGPQYLPDPETVNSVTLTLSTADDVQAVIENENGTKTETHVTNTSLWITVDNGHEEREYLIATADNGAVSFISNEPGYGNQPMNTISGPVKHQLANAVTPNEVVDTGAFNNATASIIDAIHTANLTGTRTKQYLQQALINPDSTGDSQ